jgi:acyl carrier protein
MDAPDVALRIETFIREAFQIAADDPGFSRSVDLFEVGYVDSVGVIETLAFITETFGVEVPDEALLSNEFATIDGMAQVVVELARTAASPSAARPAA